MYSCVYNAKSARIVCVDVKTTIAKEENDQNQNAIDDEIVKEWKT